jgi:hypothetical protein
MLATIRNDLVLEQLELELAQGCGDLAGACKKLGFARALLSVRAWMRDDPEAARRIRAAQQVGYLGLEAEAKRRAVDGVEEDVYYQGEVVGKKRVYSDTLLALMLKAKAEGFKDEEKHQAVVQVNIMPRPDTYEAWIAVRDNELASRASAMLPAPVIEDAQFTEIETVLTFKDAGI